MKKIEIEELRAAWNEQSFGSGPIGTSDTSVMAQELEAEYRKFHKTIFWRDFREMGCAIAIGLFFLATDIQKEILWPTIVAVVLLWIVGLVLYYDRRVWNRTAKTFENNVRGSLLRQKAYYLNQAKLLKRDIIWTYLAPIFLALVFLTWGDVLNGDATWAETQTYGIVCLAGALVIYGLNWFAGRQLEAKAVEVDEQVMEIVG